MSETAAEQQQRIVDRLTHNASKANPFGDSISVVEHPAEASAGLDVERRIRSLHSSSGAGLDTLLRDLVEAGYRPAVKTHIFVTVESVERMEAEGWTILPDGHAMGWVIDAWSVTGEQNIVGATLPTIQQAIEYTRREMDKLGHE